MVQAHHESTTATIYFERLSFVDIKKKFVKTVKNISIYFREVDYSLWNVNKMYARTNLTGWLLKCLKTASFINILMRTRHQQGTKVTFSWKLFLIQCITGSSFPFTHMYCEEKTFSLLWRGDTVQLESERHLPISCLTILIAAEIVSPYCSHNLTHSRSEFHDNIKL